MLPKPITTARIKFIKSLKLKKYRLKERLFLVEGTKNVLELLQSDFQVKFLVGVPSFYEQYPKYITNKNMELLLAKIKDLERIGTFKTNNSVLAVAKCKEYKPVKLLKGEWGLLLDSINDPGNLGTILRTADWYGISKIVASNTCSEVYNPKVVNSSMGSFTRITYFQTDLLNFLPRQKDPVFGADMKGENVHNIKFPKQGWLLIGSESHGIHSSYDRFIKKKIAIPGFGKAESLNAAISTAVILDNLRRNA